ncbi:hypothetical protein MTR67_052322 [Solanum verrucosum]|uniref:Integrase catalytic domain-containing protein n=1 Tax=Solanum verrucosum TaxID=315347 RepID=A0AAF0ZZU5_SOLVR|nr:hypothetical protein MTR67_052322 [Solanum verrucosum]
MRGLSLDISIPTWKWEDLNMDFIFSFPRTWRQYDYIWVIVDLLKKSTQSLSFKKGLGTRVKLSTAFHPQTDRKAECTIQTFGDMLRACVIEFNDNWGDHFPLIEFVYNNSYHSSICMAPFESIYGRRCRSSLGWFEAGEVDIIGPEMVHEAMKKCLTN